MKLLAGKKKAMLWVWIASIAYIALNTVFIALEWFYMPLLPVVLLVAVLSFTRLDIIIYAIVFFAPLSLQLSFLKEGLLFDLYLPTEPLLAALLLVFVLRFLSGSRLDLKIMRHPVSIAVLFSMAWMAITIIPSSDPLVSIKYFISRSWFVVGFYFLAVELFKKEKNMHRYVWMYVISFSIIVAYTLIRHSAYGLDNQIMSHSMMQPFYKDHTSYGATLAFIIPVLISFFFVLRREDINTRTLMVLLILYFAAATVFSYTRAAWVSLVGALGIWLIMRLKIKFEFLAVAGVVLIALFFVFRPVIMMQLEDNNQRSSGDFAEHIQSISNISNDESNLERINRWSCALRMFQERPVFGFGPGTYQFEYGRFQRSYEESEISTSFGNLGTAHSEYLGPLSEMGLFGLLAVLVIIVSTIITAVRVYTNSSSRTIKAFSIGVFIGLCTYYIHGIMNNFLDTDKASALFWGYTAMLVAMDLYHRESASGKLDSEDGDIIED